ncbi:MAG: adenylate/guanylate cyclase domain-containing protein [Chthoniobacterales bacterium]
MKRHIVAALVIGLIVAGLIIGLEIAGLLARPDEALSRLFPETANRLMPTVGYGLIVIVAMGVAFLTLSSSRRHKMLLIVAILLVELLGVAWVCSLYKLEFQPLPAIAAALLGFLGAIAFVWFAAYLEERRSRPPKISAGPTPREAPISVVPDGPKAVPVAAPQPVAPPPVVEKPRARARRSDSFSDSGARVCEVTAVVCDLANKHDFAEECEPAVFAEITERFIAHAIQSLRAEGAYIESAGGEGVVAIFGYPENDKQHAEKAVRKAMALTTSFAEANKGSKSDQLRNAGVHAGVSSGTMIMAPMKNNGQRNMLAAGEPVELARRFCIANRFYGSRVLLGPRTFELASKILVARPIDFLSGVDVRERHEIYEPVALALNASREIITRRDAFWNGVVLYREKRWAEAYSQFQNARGPEGEEDRPLQLYLRRLEPLALQLTNTPLDQ